MHRSRNRRDGITSRFRLRGYDYSLPGYYFVTICIADRSHRLGTVVNGQCTPSGPGKMIVDFWMHQAERFPGIELDEFCVMPNHFHELIGIATRDEEPPEPVSLPIILHGFKSATTIAYGVGVREQGWPRYDARLWQKGYHEHIVRNDRDLERIRDYIVGNPASWPQDTFYVDP